MPETVSILHESRVRLPVAPGASRTMIALTYAVADFPPRIVYVDPGHDSPEERKRLITEDLRAARARTPTTLDVG